MTARGPPGRPFYDPRRKKHVEPLKAAYTQIGTMAAVMIIFSTNMLLARTKLDIRSAIGARKQVMNFYTLAWILADVSFINCALFCVMLKLAMNECPDEVCAVRFADRFGNLSMTPIFMLCIACMCVIVGMGLYIYVTLGAAFRQRPPLCSEATPGRPCVVDPEGFAAIGVANMTLDRLLQSYF